MSRITRSLLCCLIGATTVLSLVCVSQPCSAYQFSMKPRRSLTGRQTYKPVYKVPTNSPTSHWAFRSRSLKTAPIANRNNYGVGVGLNASQLYWANLYSSRSRSAFGVSRYPSNITAYDAEFRNSKRAAVPTSAIRTVGVNRDVDPSAVPTTITNSHFQSSPQRVINNQFDLQQRLLESRETPSIKSAAAASNLQGHAEKAFQEGRYKDAVYYSDRAVKADPYNGLMHLFCSQCNFAVGNYSVAILMLEQATSMLPESQWGYIAKHYDTFYGQNDYVPHTRSLANYLKRRPDDNRARTLLGYHYGCLGYKTTASKLFHQSLQTYSNDDLAQRLISIFGDANYSSPVVKQVQAPTPDLLDESAVYQTGVNQESANRRIYLMPAATVSNSPMEELPVPEEPFFEHDGSAQSVLMPSLDSPVDR